MVKIKQLTLASIVIFLCSCGLVYDRGQMVDGRYLPKKSNYDLKDKANNIIPSNLDTVGVYVAVASYSSNVQKDIHKFYFLKFYPNGRILDIHFRISDSLILKKSYKEAVMERKIYTNTTEGYYYSKDGKHIQIESFVPDYDWPITGHYEKDNYYLNASGDTLTQWESKDKYKMIFVKEKLPKVLKGYPVNW